MYQRSPNPSTENAIRLLIASATRKAKRARQGREREITVRPSDQGWTAMEFTQGGGSWLATDADYDTAVRAAIGFLVDVLATGAQPNLEIIIGHDRCYAPGLGGGQ